MIRLLQAGWLNRKTPWRDSSPHRVMGPFKFTQRLAALVAQPSETG